MRRWKRVVMMAAVVGGAAAVWGVTRLVAEKEQWPPSWYVDPATNRAEFAALRRRAIATPTTEFPPNAATLAYLRNLAVGAATAPGSRLDEARVYPGPGYLLQLRGRFSTAEISPPPGLGRRHVLPPFCPCLTFALDTATLSSTSVALGECEDFSFLGEGLQLDLSEESG